MKKDYNNDFGIERVKQSPNFFNTLYPIADLHMIKVQCIYLYLSNIFFSRHNITTKKESGVISGVQHTLDGPIEWSRELPDTCRLSQYATSCNPVNLNLSNQCCFNAWPILQTIDQQ